MIKFKRNKINFKSKMRNKTLGIYRKNVQKIFNHKNKQIKIKNRKKIPLNNITKLSSKNTYC